MKNAPRRIDVLRAGAGLAAASVFPASALAQDVPKLAYGDLASGVTGIVSSNMAANRFDLKHGVDLGNALPYNVVSTYYNDFAAGTFEVAMGSWDFFIDMFQKGVPIKMVCTITTADMINIVAGPAIKTPADLVGKSMSAVIGSGSYAMTRTVMSDVEKIDLDKQVQMQNAPNPAGCIALLSANSVVAALSWEPAISQAIAQEPALRSIFNLGSAYRRTGRGVLPYFSVAVRDETLKKTPGVAARIAAAFGDCINYINRNPAQAFRNAAPKTGLTPAVMQSAFDDKRLVFNSVAMGTPNGQKVVMDAYTYMHAHGMFEKPLTPDFFA